MPPSTLVETEYSPLSTMWSDSDTLPPKHKVLIRGSKRTPKLNSTTLRRKFFLRIGGFVIIEAGFIIFAALAYNSAILLHLSPRVTLTEAKGALTTISIIWHILAVFAVNDIILHVFSAEWMEQYRKSGIIVLGETDAVSRVTSGVFDQARHFTSRTATSPFRLAFLSTLLLMALRGLGPSTITVNSISVGYPLKIKVANLTMTSNLANNGADTLVVDRANLITRLEQLENSTYGFRTSQINNLIPWPSSNSTLAIGTVRYQSDVIHYQFNCSWKQPTVNHTIRSWNVDGREWGIHESPTIIDLEGRFGDAMILPMQQYITPMAKDADSPLIAFLFIGGNTTLSSYVVLNLEDVPTNFIPAISNFTIGNNTSPALVSALVCDPQLQIQPATVVLSGGSLSMEATTQPSINNIPLAAANAIFSQSLLEATSTRESYTDQSIVNAIACTLFLTDPTFSYNDKPAGIKPLSLDQINEKMNTILLSSAKAFLSGYKPDEGDLTFPSFEMMDTDAVADKEELAIVGSRPFLIALSAVVVVMVILLVALVAVVRIDQLQTFDLENIVKTLKID